MSKIKLHYILCLQTSFINELRGKEVHGEIENTVWGGYVMVTVYVSVCVSAAKERKKMAKDHESIDALCVCVCVCLSVYAR
jgi:hypothetical protein